MDQTVTKLANDPEIKPLLAVIWMRPEQRDEHRQDIEEVETVLNDPARRKGIVNPGTLRTQAEQRTHWGSFIGRPLLAKFMMSMP